MIRYHYEAISGAVYQWWISRVYLVVQFCAINADSGDEKNAKEQRHSGGTAAAAEQTVHAVC